MPELPQERFHVHPARETLGLLAPQTLAPMSYAELHCLSNFSFLRGASHPEELVERAAELGYAALAITDRNSLAGVVRAHVAVQALQSEPRAEASGHTQRHAGTQARGRAHSHEGDGRDTARPLRLIIGAEITPLDAPPLVLLAPDRAAYGRLARLITRGRLRCCKGECELYFSDIAELAEGLIAIVLPSAEAPKRRSDAVPSDETTERRSDEGRGRGIAESRGKGIRKFAASLDPSLPWSLGPFHAYRSIFLSGNLYLAAELLYDVPDSIRLAQLAELSRCTGIPLVACNAVHYHIPQRRCLQDVLTCIREGCTLAEAGSRLFANAERHLRPLDEIARRYAGYEDALARTVEIAARCTFSLDELRYEYPHELVPERRTAMEYLEVLTWAGAAERYGVTSLPRRIRDLLGAELALIRALRYEHYFLTVWDLCRFARSRNILCQGRGSAANSAVCYCLGITAVDPARHDLLFERFMSRERNEPPDIDIDFEHERREGVIQYIYEKYGRERAAITAEVITYRPRSAVRDVGKTLGLSLDRIDVLAKALDWFDEEAVPAETIRSAGLDPSDRTIRLLAWLVKQLLGFPRHLSQHVGGFVITESPLCEIVPLENGAMPGRTFIEWDKDDIDALGILKVDVLGLGMLTALSKCFTLLKRGSGSADQGSGVRDPGSGIGDRESVGQSWFDAQGGHHNDLISRTESMARVDRAGQGDLRAHAPNAGRGTIRAHEPDPARCHLDPKQHRRGQRSTDTQGLHSLSYSIQGISGRARDSVNYCSGAQNDPRMEARVGTHWGRHTHAAGADQQPSTPSPVTAVSLVPIPDPRSPIPRSLLDIPPDDPAVYDMICAADTIGVFQIESRAQMSMLPRLRPRCFYDLVIEVAIVRPGPIQGGMVHPYLRRRNGLEPVAYPSQDVKRVLEKTLGVPLFQEQVMRLAVVAAGFTPGQADQLRRAMAAWRRSGQIEKFQTQLIRGMLARGYSKQFAEQIYRQIQGFGEYGFPESHAASFALLVYASAWLKRYYPAAFCAAMLNSQPLGFYTPGQLVRDAIAHGVEVRPVDVNYSEWDCTLERGSGIGDQGTGNMERDSNQPFPIPDPGSPLPDPCAWGRAGPALRLGFRMVRGLSEEKLRGLIAARRMLVRDSSGSLVPRSLGPFTSLRQLVRAGVSRETLLRLAAADAFGSLGLNRRQALWEILALDRDQGSGIGEQGSGMGKSDGEPIPDARTPTPDRRSPIPLLADLAPDEPPVALPPTPLVETVVHDYDALGFSLNAHPMELVRAELEGRDRGIKGSRDRGSGHGLRVLRAAELRSTRNRQRVAVAGLVTCRQRPGTAGGIIFMTLEDETGMANLIVRPQVWERDRAIARSRIALIAEGVIERQGEVVHVMVRRFHDLSALLAGLTHRSRDFC